MPMPIALGFVIHALAQVPAPAPEKTIAETEIACEAGEGMWCRVLSRHLKKQGKHDEAFRWATRGCDAKDAASCVDVAFAWEKGNGRPRDDGKALSGYTRGCEL